MSDMSRRSSVIEPILGCDEPTGLNGKLGHSYRVIEVAGRDSFLNRGDIIRVNIRLYHDLYALAQPCKLVADVSCPAQALELKELLVTKLLRKVCFHPLLPHIEEGKVIPTGSHEILPCLICVQLLILGAVKQGARFRKHGNDSQNLPSMLVGTGA